MFSVGFALLFGVYFALAPPLTASAAEIYFDNKNQEIRVGDQFEVGVFINTEKEFINVIEGKIIFPEEFLEVKEIRDGNSIVNFWVERPKVGAGEILFSGIIPGGYLNEKGLIFSIIFQLKQEGRGVIEAENIKVLLNDGQGTETEVNVSNFNFVILKQIPSSVPIVIGLEDTEPPESFVPATGQDAELFDNKWFLAFATQDKISGVAYYAIHESTRMKTQIAEEEWIAAESPYVLEDQKLRSYIYVKAVDKNGNERVVMLPSSEPPFWHKNYIIYTIYIVFGLYVIGIIWKKIWRKK